MKKGIARLAAVALVALSFSVALIGNKPVFAQQPPAKGGGSGADQMKKELNLTPDQESKMKAIGQKYQQQMVGIQQRIMSKFKPDIDAVQKAPEAQRQQKGAALAQKMMAASKTDVRGTLVKMFNEMDTVLKPDQKAKFAKYKKSQLDRFDQQMVMMEKRVNAAGAGAGAPKHP